MKKAFLTALSALMIFALVFCLSSCFDIQLEDPEFSSSEEISEIRKIYESYRVHAEAKGKQPLSYEEWLSTIRGEKGEQGELGQDGVGIEKVECDENGNLVITFTNGTTQTVEMPKDNHEHLFSEWVEFSSQTTDCSVKLYYRICSECSDIEWKQGSHSDHEFELVEVVESNCLASGYRVEQCTRCCLTKQEDNDLLGEHKYGLNGVCVYCGKQEENTTYTYKTHLSASPTDWNELTYQEGSDGQLLNYITSNLFELDFAFDKNGEIIPGGYEVKYSFATKLEDVTEQYVGKYGVKSADSALVWKITIREDGKWQNGDLITAGDFVYTMQEQLNPLFFNRRASDFFSGSLCVYNAQEYYLQNQTVIEPAKNKYSHWNESAILADNQIFFDLESEKSGVIKYFISQGYESHVQSNGGILLMESLVGIPEFYLRPLQGKTYAEITANAELFEAYSNIIVAWENYLNKSVDELDFFTYQRHYPKLSWDQVGMFSVSNSEIVLALNSPVEFIDENGKLAYKAVKALNALPLVHKSTYESCKIEPQEAGGLWTSVYNSSLQNTMSWGPYKLSSFKADEYYALEKNSEWFGYGLTQYGGQYQATSIECEIINSYDMAFLKFVKGELSEIELDFANAIDYKNSERAYFAPNGTTYALHLQSNEQSLENREKPGINKTILANLDFRKAISFAINRDELNNYLCFASAVKGFGIIDPSVCYNKSGVELYRYSDASKRALCDVYGVDVSKYASLNEAYASITAYDLATARNLLEKAYKATLALGKISRSDKVVLTYGCAQNDERANQVFNFIKNTLENLAKGTSLEGRLTCELDTTFASVINGFSSGGFDILLSDISVAGNDCDEFLKNLLSDDCNYLQGFDSYSHNLEITVHGVKLVNGNYVITNSASNSVTATLPINGYRAEIGCNSSWYQLLTNEFAQGVLADEFRLEIIARLESEILSLYYNIPVCYGGNISLLSYQVEYATEYYNEYMKFGGVRYASFNYSDANWKEYLKNNALDYAI